MVVNNILLLNTMMFNNNQHQPYEKQKTGGVSNFIQQQLNETRIWHTSNPGKVLLMISSTHLSCSKVNAISLHFLATDSS